MYKWASHFVLKVFEPTPRNNRLSLSNQFVLFPTPKYPPPSHVLARDVHSSPVWFKTLLFCNQISFCFSGLCLSIKWQSCVVLARVLVWSASCPGHVLSLSTHCPSPVLVRMLSRSCPDPHVVLVHMLSWSCPWLPVVLKLSRLLIPFVPRHGHAWQRH